MASIDKRPNGGYRARWREHPGGPQQTRQFARKVDAVRFLDGIRGDIAHGLYVDPNGGRTPFQDYAERWRAGQLHRPSTATQAETYLRVHAYPTSPRRHRDRCPRRASGPVSAGRTCTSSSPTHMVARCSAVRSATCGAGSPQRPTYPTGRPSTIFGTSTRRCSSPEVARSSPYRIDSATNQQSRRWTRTVIFGRTAMTRPVTPLTACFGSSRCEFHDGRSIATQSMRR